MPRLPDSCGSLGLHRAHAQHSACGPRLPRQRAPSPRPSGPPQREGAPRLPPQPWGTLRQRGGSESLARTTRSAGLQPGHTTGVVPDPVPTPGYYHKVLGGDETGTVARGLYNTTRVCFGLGGHRKHTLQDNPILQARILTAEGSSSTLGVDNTFGEVRPSLGRRRGPRVSALKDDVITTPGPLPPGSSPRIRPEQAARLVDPRPRPAVPQRHQPGPRPRKIYSGVGPANGRPGQAPADQVFFSSQLCLCSR
jgi:hypothetical protein